VNPLLPLPLKNLPLKNLPLKNLPLKKLWRMKNPPLTLVVVTKFKRSKTLMTPRVCVPIAAKSMHKNRHRY
jgi:hypothetical protein